MRIESRLLSFDLLRCISIIGILLCHSCNKFPTGDWFGFFCACTFNFLFVIMSAFLLGLAWEKCGRQPYGKDFLLKRILKLCVVYYPFLIILFLLLYIKFSTVESHKIVTHFLYLPWFDKIGGFHHLWFMSLIVICYLSCALFSNLPGMNRKIIIGIGGLFTIFVTFMCMKLGLPSYLAPYVYLYIIVFNYSSRLLRIIKGFKPSVISITLIPLLILCILYFKTLNSDSLKLLPYIIGIISASSIFIIIYRLFNFKSLYSPILLISTISFEIYLVHMFFLNYVNVYSMIDNIFLAFFFLLFLSISSAFILNKLGFFINKSLHYHK